MLTALERMPYIRAQSQGVTANTFFSQIVKYLEQEVSIKTSSALQFDINYTGRLEEKARKALKNQFDFIELQESAMKMRQKAYGGT